MASIKSTSAASVGLLQFELVPDDPRNTCSADDASITFLLLFWRRSRSLRKRPESWEILWGWPPWIQKWWC